MKKVLVLVGMMVLGSSLLFAQPKEKPELPEQASEVAEEKVEWLWKKDFPEEIKDMIIETKKVKKKALKEGKETEIEEEFAFPKVVITERGIKFFDEAGKVKREHRFISEMGRAVWSKVRKSNNGRFIGVNEGLKYGEKEELIEKGKFTMFSNEGEILWETEHTSDYIQPSPDGTYGIGENAMQLPVLNFIYPGYSKLVELGFKTPNAGEFKRAVFSDEGDFLAVNAKEVYWAGDKPYLSLFDKEGNQLWRKKLEVHRAGGLTFSPDGRLLTLGGQLNDEQGNWIKSYQFVFDINGELLWEKEIEPRSAYHYRFSRDKKLLLAVGERAKQIYLFEAMNGNVLWKYDGNLLGGDYFAKVETTPNLDYILIITQTRGGYEFVGNFEWLYLFNNKGEKLWEKNFPPYYITDEGPPFYAPHVFLTGNGENIILNTKEGIEKIDISSVLKKKAK